MRRERQRTRLTHAIVLLGGQDVDEGVDEARILLGLSRRQHVRQKHCMAKLTWRRSISAWRRTLASAVKVEEILSLSA